MAWLLPVELDGQTAVDVPATGGSTIASERGSADGSITQAPRSLARADVPYSIPWVTIIMMQTLFCLKRRCNRHGAHMLLAGVPWATLTMHLRRLAACSPTAEGCVKLALWLGQHQELESDRRTGGIIAGTTVAQALQ